MLCAVNPVLSGGTWDRENTTNPSETANPHKAARTRRRQRNREISPTSHQLQKFSFHWHFNGSLPDSRCPEFCAGENPFEKMFCFFFQLVRTLLEHFDQQLRENQSEWDFLHLISCLVILSRGAGAKRQFDETHIRVDACTLMTVHASVPRPGEQTATNSLTDRFVIRPHVRVWPKRLWLCLSISADTPGESPPPPPTTTGERQITRWFIASKGGHSFLCFYHWNLGFPRCTRRGHQARHRGRHTELAALQMRSKKLTTHCPELKCASCLNFAVTLFTW